MRNKQATRYMIALGAVVSSQSVWASGIVPSSAVIPIVLGQQALRKPESRPVLLPSTPVSKNTAPLPVAPVRYKVRSGDSLEIKIMGRPELTQSMTVAPDGTIIYPYVGEVAVAGDSVMQIISKLKIGLKRQFENPQPIVSVLKRQMGEVSILGPVKEPGKKELGDDWRVLNLIAEAGGMTVERTEFVTIRLVRRGGQVTFNVDPVQLLGSGDPNLNYLLEDGDLLVIQERDKNETMVQVLGEVGKPGYVVAPRDGSPLAALAAAGGSSSKAALSRASIRRGSGGTPIPVDLTNPDRLPQSLQLGPGDTLVIPANVSQVFLAGSGVIKPGMVELPDKIQPTIYWAIQQAGGTTQEADLKNASITRLAPNGAPITEKIDLEKVMKNRTAQGKDAEVAARLNRMLMPGDILEIPTKRRRSGGFRLGFNELALGLSTFLMLRQAGN
jgi:protein involved in polysaccharide export with SLBB domain